ALPPEASGDMERLYREAYDLYEAAGSGDSRPYPGAVEALESLAASGAPLAIVSNKPETIARNMMDDLFPGVRFALVRGGRAGQPIKPDPTGAFEAGAACGAAPRECAFVGDSDVDMRTAQAAGMLPVGAAWGFRGEAELRDAGAVVIAASMADIPPLLGSSF
ncbi:MAG TPA: HAD family hydrolase, partial [Spirochaetales bacterium]|nr:HAD family hydrolase [Spirochaetales bacterium]